jgi:3-isopropylmalate dehydrogenase
MKKVLLLGGDGIGPEIVNETKKIIDFLNSQKILDIETEESLIGGASIDAYDTPLTDETLNLAKSADAVLLGAVGGPKWDNVGQYKRPEAGLLNIRKGMGVYSNLRPATVFPELCDASTLKEKVVSGLDIMIVRELLGGIYFGEPRGIEDLPNGGKKAWNTLVYSTDEIEKIAKSAFEIAMVRGKKVCSVDKSNVLVSTKLWKDTVTAYKDKYYPEVELSHMYVDNAAMQLVRNPKQFDVILTTNMFGDILSDCAAMVTGSLGMLPSASLGDKKENGMVTGLYEPVHGSAPDIAGKGISNPLATILSFAMMLKYSFNQVKESDIIIAAVRNVLKSGIRTKDIMQEGMKEVGTEAIGDEVIKALQKLV